MDQMNDPNLEFLSIVHQYTTDSQKMVEYLHRAMQDDTDDPTISHYAVPAELMIKICELLDINKTIVTGLLDQKTLAEDFIEQLVAKTAAIDEKLTQLNDLDKQRRKRRKSW